MSNYVYGTIIIIWFLMNMTFSTGTHRKNRNVRYHPEQNAILSCTVRNQKVEVTSGKGIQFDINKGLEKIIVSHRKRRDIEPTPTPQEHGVCGYLKDRVDHCCVHIPNVTMDREYDISQLKRIEQEAEEERKEIGHNWIGELFNGLGIHLGGWLQSLLETICTLLLVFLVIYLVYLCIRQEITRNTSWTHKIIGAVTREYPRRLTPPPKYYETTRMEN
ncbi:uncharacterized protein LOC128850270 [Cuculus canorus]|uniref:uncharacterized protein LOC128850270 n=1 Tax=Cuculus canorus TaxID=55661 RepID=UPI0023AA2649|nr:uncharacterized protein LOC128850270 [Cuculus canorus]